MFHVESPTFVTDNLVQPSFAILTTSVRENGGCDLMSGSTIMGVKSSNVNDVNSIVTTVDVGRVVCQGVLNIKPSMRCVDF